jgi:hypothetical protein
VVVLLVVFYPTIRMQMFPVLIGFIIGALAFYTVIPSLRVVGHLVFEPIEPWQKGTPQPQW